MRSNLRTLIQVLLAAAVCGNVHAHAQSGAPALSVNISTGRYPINPNIYGIANYGLDATFAQEIKVPNTRWGGDGTTRYNWQVDASNAGADWYFMGGNGVANPTPGATPDLMIATYPTAGALITIPIIPYVNKTSAWNCSFPTSVYGAQQSTNPYVHPNNEDCGNGVSTGGANLSDTDIYANHIDNSAGLQQGWVQHLVAAHGTAAQGGVPFYQLDNEPYGWGNTHRDIEPNGADYPTITALGEQYAAIIKQVDPSASVLGPSDFTLGGWVGNTSQQNGLLAAQYYLQQMAAYEQKNGVRILDYLDEHYYPQFSDAASQLASTRTFWDPTYNGGTWVEQYVFDGPMQLLPRMQSWVAQYYPGTKISISEYSIDSGSKSIVDALAEMDVLGIYGRQRLDFADMWNTPAPTDPIAYAFRMYRDYDGNGGQYGDTWVSATSTDQSQLSVYAAQRTTDHVVTVMVINKTTAPISTTVQLAGGTLPGTASVYSYSGTNLTQIVHGSDAAISNAKISYSFPAYSATLFAFTPATAQLPATTTALSASATQITSGQSVTFTATVTGTASPTGSVTFNDGTTALGSGTLSGGQATLSTAALSVGTHTIAAVYGGDANNAGSTSAAVSITVSAAAPVPAPTKTTLTASATQITTGQSVTFTATVTGTGSPTGAVTFKDGGNSLGSATLSGGQATLSTATLSVGTHTITAVYGGDANNAGSTSAAVTITVSAAAPVLTPTKTTLTASATQITAGQSVTLTAAVTGTASPTGSVTFSDGSTTLGSATIASGQAGISTATLSVGTHSILAVYSGNATNAASTSNMMIVTVSADAPPPPAATATSLSASATQITAGQSLTFTATVAGTASPTGSVIFNDGNTSLGTAVLSGGLASLSTSALAAGTHAITAVYSGDANNAASTSSAVSVTVSQPTQPPPTLTGTATSLNVSSAQVTTAQSVVLTATVAATTGTPTGTVSFNNGATMLGTANLIAGTASFDATGLSAGTYMITADYSGDANDAPSVSAPVAITVSSPVPPPPPDFNLTLAQNAMTLAIGSSGATNLSLTPQNGFDAQVSLSCSGLPQGATCSFSPSSLTASSSLMTSSLTIATTPNTSLFGIFFLSPWLATVWTRKGRRRWKGLALTGSSLLLFIAGCGLTQNTTAANGTPAGTYTVQVTATASTGQMHTQQLSVTVQSN